MRYIWELPSQTVTPELAPYINGVCRFLTAVYSHSQYKQLELDLKQILDEKEELVTERDAFKVKYTRLNEELNTIVQGDTVKHIIDIDAKISENRLVRHYTYIYYSSIGMYIIQSVVISRLGSSIRK